MYESRGHTGFNEGRKEFALTLSLKAAEVEEFSDAVGDAGDGIPSGGTGVPLPLLFAEISGRFRKGGMFWMTIVSPRPPAGSALVVEGEGLAVLVEGGALATEEAAAAGRRAEAASCLPGGNTSGARWVVPAGGDTFWG